jgi:molybdate transport system permease protein
MTPEEWTAVRLSLLVATTATAASLPFGIAVAWLLARGRFWGKSLLDTLVHLPLILPPVVTGYLLLISFGKRGPIGAFLDEQFGIVFSFRWTGAALACAVMGFPLLVRAIRLSIEAVDTRLESAAGTLGAHPFLVFATITLPLCLPGVIAGAILCFAKAMGEFGATITFVSNIPGETQTLPSLIYTLTQIPGGDAGAMRLTLVSIAISMVALLGSELLARRIGVRQAHEPGGRCHHARPSASPRAFRALTDGAIRRSPQHPRGRYRGRFDLARSARQVAVDGQVLVDTERGPCPSTTAASATFPESRLFRISACAATCCTGAGSPATAALRPTSPRSSTCWASVPCSRGVPNRCPAARSSGWRSAAPCSPIHDCC